MVLSNAPLNYTGGKYKLLPQIIEKFPKKIGTFIDIFGGGFNVGANIEANTIIYNDKQKEVPRIIKTIFKIFTHTNNKKNRI
jgi:DNA adenine methylase